VKTPRVKTKKEGFIFSSAILPRYMRRVPSLDALIPALYLKEVATSDFPEALSAILGDSAKGLSPTNIVECSPFKSAPQVKQLNDLCKI
jgi:hypothetical protein